MHNNRQTGDTHAPPRGQQERMPAHCHSQRWWGDDCQCRVYGSDGQRHLGALQMHMFCPRCGSQTVPIESGLRRGCVQESSHKLYPRTDPVVRNSLVTNYAQMMQLQ